MADSTEISNDHFVRLDGLEPSTLYYYEVGLGRETDFRVDGAGLFHTSPNARSDSVPSRVWVIGDSGAGYREQAAVRDAYLNYTDGERTDVILMLGDNAYKDGQSADYEEHLFDVYA